MRAAPGASCFPLRRSVQMTPIIWGSGRSRREIGNWLPQVECRRRVCRSGLSSIASAPPTSTLRVSWVFDAHVLGLGTGIWADDPQGNLFPVVLPTDTLGVGKQILGISLVAFTGGDASGQPRYLNDAGQLAFVATFSDNSEGVFVATVPEPAAIAAATLLRLLTRKRRTRV